jgi:hypothetical protein
MNEAKRLDSMTAPAAHPLHTPAESPPDDGTILAMGRRFRSAVDRFTALDRQHAALPPGAPTEPVVRSWMQRADAERHRLFDRVFLRRAETLSDAAVLAAHGFHRVDCMLDTRCDNAALDERLGQVRVAFANILAVTAKAAELDICQIGYPTLGRSVRQALGGRA